jgi:GntR family transcriptional regulator, transcriptional repressor for pyruvate dehydrogenase complex
MSTELKRHRLSDQVLGRLIEMISSGEPPAGEALPSVVALSARFGVSTHVAREAIAALAARGLVRVRHGAGVFVAPRERWRLVDPEIMSLIGGEEALLHLFEVRQAFEVRMAAVAACRRTDADLAELAQAIAAGAPDRTVEEQSEADYRFHRALAGATHNPLFLPLLNAIVGPMRQYFRLSKAVPDTGSRTHQGHVEIYQRVSARDETGASAAMQAHLERGREICQRLISRGEVTIGRSA